MMSDVAARLAQASRAGAICTLLALAALAGCATTSSHPSALSYPTIPEPTATATVYATATPDLSRHAVWTRVSAASPEASGAPATLRTQYDIFSGQTSKTSTPEFRLRRSDDFGKTWVNLTPPQIPGVNYPANVNYIRDVMSPLNPKVFILTLQLTGVTCPQPPSPAAQGICQAQYVTLDGGAAWKLLALPAPGLLGLFGLTGAANSSNLSAQGTRIYGVISDTLLASSDIIPPGRLVVTSDGGATWTFADATLAAHNLLIYSYTVSPSGSTIFALVGPTNRNLPPGGTPPLALWRSDNAGASWTAAGALPARDQGAMLAASGANGQVTLYLIAGDTYNAPRLFASHDGGARWTMCSEQSSTAPSLLGALPDGSMLLDTARAVEAWDGSANAPRTVAQPSGIHVSGFATLQSQPSGAMRVWLVGDNGQGTIYEYTTLKP